MTRFATASALALAALSAVPASAQNYATLRVQNNSYATVWSVEASPTDSSSWGGDLLDNYVLVPGAGREITFVNVTNCYYDIRITFEDGSGFTDVVDLCSYNQYTVH